MRRCAARYTCGAHTMRAMQDAGGAANDALPTGIQGGSKMGGYTRPPFYAVPLLSPAHRRRINHANVAHRPCAELGACCAIHGASAAMRKEDPCFFASQGAPRLLVCIETAAMRWYLQRQAVNGAWC